MKLLGEGLKQLPDNLKFLKLDLGFNNLGVNLEHIKQLGEIIK